MATYVSGISHIVWHFSHCLQQFEPVGVSCQHLGKFSHSFRSATSPGKTIYIIYSDFPQLFPDFPVFLAALMIFNGGNVNDVWCGGHNVLFKSRLSIVTIMKVGVSFSHVTARVVLNLTRNGVLPIRRLGCNANRVRQ